MLFNGAIILFFSNFFNHHPVIFPESMSGRREGIGMKLMLKEMIMDQKAMLWEVLMGKK